MKKTARIFAVLAMALMMTFAFAACSNSNPFVGTWKASQTYGETTATMTIEIKKNEKFSMKSEAGSQSSTVEGTWKYDEDKEVLTLTYSAGSSDVDVKCTINKDGKLVIEEMGLELEKA